MSALQITITNAGRAEIINAVNTGTDPVEITQVGLGTGQYTPDPTQTALTNEVKRLSTIAGEVVDDDTIHVTVKDETSDAYDVAEFGLYLSSGTLFAVYSQASGPFMQKASASSLLLSVDVILSTIDATNLTFGDTSFSNPPASETVAGVAEVATQTETDTGADDTRIVTPKKLKNWVKQATESVLGLMKVATQAQTDAGTDDNVAVTPKKMASLLSDIMVGSVAAFACNTAPTGWLKCNGATISRTAYADLYAFAVGSGNMAASEAAKEGGQFGPGDGSTTFTIPDIRGEFVRGFDDGRGIDTGREIGSGQSEEIKGHNHDLYGTGALSSYRCTYGSPGTNILQEPQVKISATDLPANDPSGRTSDFMAVAGSGAETRPRNIALLYCIKY